MVSELATNCIRHARTAFELTIDDSRGLIRVELSDSGSGRPVRRSPEITDPTGRGLLIVEAMSDDWGAATGSGGTIVWFTLRPAATWSEPRRSAGGTRSLAEKGPRNRTGRAYLGRSLQPRFPRRRSCSWSSAQPLRRFASAFPAGQRPGFDSHALG